MAEPLADLPAEVSAQAGEKGAGEYEDKPGFCEAASHEEIQTHNYVLTPGRYVGAEEIEDDGVPFEEKMALPSPVEIVAGLLEKERGILSIVEELDELLGNDRGEGNKT